jgi:hypothetical protein
MGRVAAVDGLYNAYVAALPHGLNHAASPPREHQHLLVLRSRIRFNAARPESAEGRLEQVSSR